MTMNNQKTKLTWIATSLLFLQKLYTCSVLYFAVAYIKLSQVLRLGPYPSSPRNDAEEARPRMHGEDLPLK